MLPSRPPESLTVAFHEGCHFLNGVEESLLQVQLALKSISL